MKCSEMLWKEQMCVWAKFTFMLLHSLNQIEGGPGDQHCDSAPSLRHFSPTPQIKEDSNSFLYHSEEQKVKIGELTSDFWFSRITLNHLLCHCISANGDIQANVLLFPVTETFERLSSTSAKRGWHVNVVLTWLMQHYLLFTPFGTLLQTWRKMTVINSQVWQK